MAQAGILSSRNFLIFVEDLYEDLELWYPKLRLQEAGAEVTVAGPQAGKTYSGKHSYPCRSDAAIADVHSSDYDGVILAGGWMPDKLRRDARVLQFIRECARDSKVVAAICHGGWLAISAGVYRGVQVTGSLGIKDDLVNAGAIWQDAPCVIDRHFISSRKPDDLPAFCTGIIETAARQPEERRRGLTQQPNP